MQFKDVIGQEKVKAYLQKTVQEKRISHAQLFLGPEGSGSLALAFAYAQYVTCKSRHSNDSCGICISCRKYQKLIHPDLHFSYPFFAKHKEDTALTFITQWRKAFLADPYLSLNQWRELLEAGNKQANINVAECLSIIQKLSLKPFESDYKVLIMWLPEHLERVGNLLLKTIEEPPPQTLLLFVAQNTSCILPTFLSRTQLVRIPSIQEKEIKDYLIGKEKLNHTRAAQIAYLSEGNMSLAKSLLREDATKHFDLFTSWLRACFVNQGIVLVDYAEKLAKLGRENQKNFLNYGTKLFREALLMKSGADVLVRLPSVEFTFIQKLSKVVPLNDIQNVLEELEQAYYHIERNANPKILFLSLSLRLVRMFTRVQC